MRAVFFEAFRTLALRETPIPEPGPGEVRLKVRYCGICGSDLTVWKTGVLSGPDVILGHEISAVVDADPSGAWQSGARVAPFPRGSSCGECLWCVEGQPRWCLNPPSNPDHGGGFAEYVVRPATSLLAIPDGVDERTAAAAEPLGVALRGVELAGPRAGAVAFVSGLGPIGLFTVAGLVASECRVIGADPREARRDLAMDQGCEEAFDPTAEDVFARLRAFDPHGPAMSFECAGVPESLQMVFDACGNGGVVGVLGIPMGPTFLLMMTLKELRAFSIQGPSVASMRRALDMLAERPQIGQVVTGVVPLEEAPAAFDALVSGGPDGKVLVAPEV